MNTKWKIFKTIIKEYFAFKRFSRLDEQKRNESSIPDKFTKSILALGPTFIKIGQILSTRPDLLPEQYITALEQLQENVSPFDFSVVEKIISDELKQPLKNAYAHFNPVPIASASLSQVHFAVLSTGEEVAVKILRPDLRKIIEHDLVIIGQLLPFARIFNKKLYDNLNISSVFAEFRRYTLQEIDFEIEGRTYSRFKNNFRGDKTVIFPEIFWSHTTSKVLTMSRVEGMRLKEASEKIPAEKKRILTENIVRILIQMFVRDGFFHADLHPGNVFFKEDGKIVLLDVGMFGELTVEQRERFILYWLAIVLKEKDRALWHLIQLTTKTADADEVGYFTTYSAILESFYSATIKEKSLTQTYLEILITGARYGFVFPSEMLLQAKALTTAEHIGYVLVPDFNFADTAKSYVTDALAERFTLNNITGRISRSIPEWFLFGESTRHSLLDDRDPENEVWVTGSKRAAKRLDEIHDGDYKEVRQGEYSIEIDKNIETVFNFVSRFAQYPLWHPVYTEKSHVIHVSGEYIFITSEAIGSVFRLDEIVDGFHLLSNGIITDFERNKLFKWKAPFSMLPVIELGTCLTFEPLENGKTRLSEYFFFSESPLKHFFINRKWFSAEALTQHIQEELTGVKHLIESGNYSEADVGYLWDNIHRPVRFLNSKTYLRDDH